MGLFDVFRGKGRKGNIEAVLIGYFRVETSKLLGHDVNSKKFDDACESAGEALQSFLPILNRDIQQEIANTISSACPTRFDEAFGHYMILLFVRFGVIQKAIIEKRVKAEEATPDILANVIHNQIKNLIRQS